MGEGSALRPWRAPPPTPTPGSTPRTPNSGLASALLPLSWLRHAVDNGGHVGGAIELDLGQATAVGGNDPGDLCGQRGESAEISRELFQTP